MQTEVVWRPQAGPQKALVDCPFPEVFFGGARGGGKTDGVLGKWALKEQRYGPAFNAIGFRRTTVSFEDAVQRARQIYLPLGAKFTDKPARFRMPNGGRVSFSYLDSIADADEYQGRNLSDAWVEEAGQYPDPSPIDRLFGALRSVGGVPVQLILTANPGGAGQHWIATRYGMIPFPRRPKVVERRLPDGAVHKMAVIPSRITDNKLLLGSDPGYIHRLQLVGSAALVRAWIEGDWSAIEGAFFTEWTESQHVITPFAIPDHWLRFRSGDWGSAKPFSIGWWAVVSDDYLAGPANGNGSALYRRNNRGDEKMASRDGIGQAQSSPKNASGVLPRGAIIRYREWYGASAPNVGLKLTAEAVAAGIVEREISEPRDARGDTGITYGVFDPAAFASDGGPSIAERMAMPPNSIYWQRADNARVARGGAMGGWDQVRSRLIGTAQRDAQTLQIDWSTGRPMIYVFSTCRDFIRTLPALQHDRSKAEDVDTDSEDHAPDEGRYACMSRPWINEAPQAKQPKFLQDATLDEMWASSSKRVGRRI
jgi:hypothetical protein